MNPARSRLGLILVIFCTFLPELWPLIDLRLNFVFAQYLENKLTEFHQFYMCINIDKIYVKIISCHFSHICARVMALDLSEFCFRSIF